MQGEKFLNPLEDEDDDDDNAISFKNPLEDDDSEDDSAQPNGLSAKQSRDFDSGGNPTPFDAKADSDGAPPKSPKTPKAMMQLMQGGAEFEEIARLELETDKAQRTKFYGLLHPSTTASAKYDIAQGVVLIYIVCVVPWRIAYDIDPGIDEWTFWADVIVDMALVCDIVLNLFKYYYDAGTGKLVTDPGRIRANYMSSWMLFDVVAILPFEHIAQLIVDHSSANVTESTKLVRLARLGRFLRLTKLTTLKKVFRLMAQKLMDAGVPWAILDLGGRVVVLTFGVWMFGHLTGCLWINQAFLQMESTGELNVWFVHEYREYLQQGTQMNDTELQAQLMGGDRHTWNLPPTSDPYIAGNYFTLLTMASVGFGDNLKGHTYDERKFCCAVIVFGTFVWAYIAGAFSSALNNLNKDKYNYDAMIRGNRAYLLSVNVKMELLGRIEDFFEYRFAGNILYDEAAILAYLPPMLRSEYYLFRFRKTIAAIPFFRGCHKDAIVDIVSSMSSYTVIPGNFLFHKGDPDVQLCVLLKGRMALVNESTAEDEDKMEAEYKPGSYFGEHEFLGFDTCRSESYRARMWCEVSSLHPLNLKPVLEQHLRLKRRFEQYVVLKRDLMDRISSMSAVSEAGLEAPSLTSLKAEVDAEAKQIADKCQQAFDAVDSKGSGKIDGEGVRQASIKLESPLKEWAVKEGMRDMDTNGSGFVTFDEFHHWWAMREDEGMKIGEQGTTHEDPGVGQKKRLRHIIEAEQEFDANLKQVGERMNAHIKDFRARLATLQRSLGIQEPSTSTELKSAPKKKGFNVLATE